MTKEPSQCHLKKALKTHEQIKRSFFQWNSLCHFFEKAIKTHGSGFPANQRLRLLQPENLLMGCGKKRCVNFSGFLGQCHVESRETEVRYEGLVEALHPKNKNKVAAYAAANNDAIRKRLY